MGVGIFLLNQGAMRIDDGGLSESAWLSRFEVLFQTSVTLTHIDSPNESIYQATASQQL